MSKEFITPVSMECTREQFERDLEKQLAALGYETKYIGDFGEISVLCTNYTYRSEKVTNLSPCKRNQFNRHYIDHYSPELFLALAAMTDEEYGIAGEWWVFINDSYMFFTKNKLYKCLKPIDQYRAFIDDGGKENGFSHAPLENFRKATKEELINHFTKQQTEMEIYEIPSSEFSKIINIACSTWQGKLNDYASANYDFSKQVVKVNQTFLDGMLAAATTYNGVNQRELIEKVFGLDDTHKYVPYTFEDAEQLLGMKLKSKDGSIFAIISYVDIVGFIMLGGNISISYPTLLRDYTTLDGQPLGKLVE